MIERINNEAPKEIVEWLMSPYIFFSEKLSSDSLLDIACGNNYQLKFLKEKFNKIKSVDKFINNNEVIQGDITNIEFDDNEFNISFSFETIEHLNTNERGSMISELFRVTKNSIVIGTVNRTGPRHINNIEIFKDGNNPYHIVEYNTNEFLTMCQENILNIPKVKSYEYFSCMYNENTKEFYFTNNLERNSISNYILINL